MSFMKNCLAILVHSARRKILQYVGWVWKIQKMKKCHGVCEGSVLSAQENQTLFLLAGIFGSIRKCVVSEGYLLLLQILHGYY